ncbi:hypothetical protein BDZ45DRAFT_744515 [Acephala macrosclerotiorum]|nr:hypothetical protein BDZ45DRAFT_744515 [Acephala macrosclerotiorum]
MPPSNHSNINARPQPSSSYIHTSVPGDIRNQFLSNHKIIPKHSRHFHKQSSTSMLKMENSNHSTYQAGRQPDTGGLGESGEDFWTILEVGVEYEGLLVELREFHINKKRDPSKFPKHEKPELKFVQMKDIEQSQACRCYGPEHGKEKMNSLRVVDLLVLKDLHQMWHQIRDADASPKAYAQLEFHSLPTPKVEIHTKAIPKIAIMKVYKAFKHIQGQGRSFVYFLYKGEDPGNLRPSKQ